MDTAILPRSPICSVGAASTEEHVVPGLAEQRVASTCPSHLIIPRPCPYLVILSIAMKEIPLRPPEDPIIPTSALQFVPSVIPEDDVVPSPEPRAIASKDQIPACAPVYPVVATAPHNVVVLSATADEVSTSASFDVVGTVETLYGNGLARRIEPL